MHHLICVQCKEELRVVENGVAVSDRFGSYWLADFYRCPKCGFEALAGFGRKPVLENWQEDFEEAKLQLEDNRTIIKV